MPVTSWFIINPSALAIGAIACMVAWADFVRADTVTYRFEAVQKAVPVAPPDGRVTAAAASARVLTGTFGYDTAAPVVDGAEVPGQVAFGAYDTGFITVDDIDIGSIPGRLGVQVTDGVTREDDPRLTIADEILLASRALSTDAPVDALSLRLTFLDAESIGSADLPQVLTPDDLADITLTFTTRIDAIADRARGQGGSVDVLGVVLFDVVSMTRVD